MKKRVLSILLTLCMALTALPLSGVPALAATSGDFEYRVLSETDKTCEITDYTGTADELEIPATLDGYTVTSIGMGAIDSCSSLTNIDIPDSVTSIGNGAFGFCRGAAFSLSECRVERSEIRTRRAGACSRRETQSDTDTRPGNDENESQK